MLHPSTSTCRSMCNPSLKALVFYEFIRLPVSTSTFRAAKIFFVTGAGSLLSNKRMGKSDQAAIRAVRSGDKDAYAELVRAHGRAVFRVARRITGNDADAEDVAQETFLR